MHTHCGNCEYNDGFLLHSYDADRSAREGAPAGINIAEPRLDARLTDRAPSTSAQSRCYWAVLVCRATTTQDFRVTHPGVQAKSAQGGFLGGHEIHWVRAAVRMHCTAETGFTKSLASCSPINARAACIHHNSIGLCWQT